MRALSTDDRLLTLAEVKQRVGLSRSSVYRALDADAFPRAIRVGPAAVRWSLREIEQWIATRPRARGHHHEGRRAS